MPGDLPQPLAHRAGCTAAIHSGPPASRHGLSLGHRSLSTPLASLAPRPRRRDGCVFLRIGVVPAVWRTIHITKGGPDMDRRQVVVQRAREIFAERLDDVAH